MANKSNVRNIVPANLFSRFFAVVLDIGMIALVAGGLYLLGGKIASGTPAVKECINTYATKVNDSGLLKFNEKDNSTDIIEKHTFEEHVDQLYTFYNGFFTNEMNDGVVRDKYWFNVYVLGQEDVKETYKSSTKVESYISTYGKQIFTYKLDSESKPILDEFAIPKVYENGAKTFEELDKADKNKINQYFFKDDETRAAIDKKDSWRDFAFYYALADLTQVKEVMSSYEHYVFYVSSIPLYASVAFSLLTFFLVIPLCFKNGETLGKLIMGVCLVNKNGYQHRRAQIVLRYLPLIILCLGLFIFFGVTTLSVCIISAVLLASYLAAVFTEKHCAFHDYAAGTLVIDKKNSTWFKDANEEAAAENEVKNFRNDIIVEDTTK